MKIVFFIEKSKSQYSLLHILDIIYLNLKEDSFAILFKYMCI